MEKEFTEALGTVAGLKRGLTTGSCAQAAAKAALLLLLTEQTRQQVFIRLPSGNNSYSGKEVPVPVESYRRIPEVVGKTGVISETGAKAAASATAAAEEAAAAAAATAAAEALVKKVAGDDPDITNGLLIGAKVYLTDTPGIRLEGGKGVGRIDIGNHKSDASRECAGQKKTCASKAGVTSASKAAATGLPLKRGQAAINPIPRKMITLELEALLPAGKGCDVIIFVPEGEKIAAKTWNPRLGIIGGISIIGTKGVVEPKSEEAYKKSINSVIGNYKKQGLKHYIITPGYVGERYLSEASVPLSRVVTAGDHIGHAITRAVKNGAERIVLVGHIGKLAKIGAGIFNTHWKSGDARLEVIAACAAACGASAETVKQILDLQLAEEAVQILYDNNLQDTYQLICQRIVYRLDTLIERAKEDTNKSGNSSKSCETGSILLSLSGDFLGAVPQKPLEEVW